MNFLSVMFRDKKHIPAILVIVALLITQAYCELELPNYTSGIVDVGIMQGGIEDAVPSKISKASMQSLKLFMTQNQQDAVDAAYEASADDADRLILKAGYASGSEARAALASDFTIPMVIGLQMQAAQQAALVTQYPVDSQSVDSPSLRLGQASVEPTNDDAEAGAAFQPSPALTALIGKVMAGQGTDEDVTAIHENIEDQMAQMGLGDTMLGTAAVEYVRAEYEALGLDMQKIQMDYMLHMAGMMAIFTLIAVAVAVLVGLLASLVSAAVGRSLRKDAFTRIMHFSNTEMDKFSHASLITRSTNDVQQIQMAVVMFLRMVLFAPAMAVGGIIMVGRTDTGLSWVIVAAVVILAAVIGTLLGVTMPKFKKMQALIDDVNLVSREILTGLPVIRAFCREDFEKKRFGKVSTALYKNQLFTNRAMMMFMPGVFFIMNIVMVGIVWFGGKGIDAGEMQVGDLMAFMSYALFIVMSFMMLAMVTIILPRATVAATRVLEVVKTGSSVADKPASALKYEEHDFAGRVVFDDVTFRYHDAEDDTLSHISFSAEPGQTTAIIGGTGSGKSTLVNLIPRLFDVTSGSVQIDGVDVRDLSQHKLRSLIGFVPQKGALFRGTIGSNIKYAGPQVTDADMRQAAEIAQAEDFIAEKEGSYEAEIAQGGSNVSGGQRQRLSIARAIAKHPKIFIFDDSFSALDFKTDAALRRALAGQVGGATVMIVAQRIATILRADKIVVVDEGEVVGIGTHQELLASCEVYREIASSQLSETELSA